jgi:hypothetical protein
MFSWKERLYAFLLKRILGPYLSVESQQQLYKRIQQVSLSEGTYVFTDLSFNTEYISSKLKNRHTIHIVSAKVHKIHIDIRLEEHGTLPHHDDPQQQQHSVPSDGGSSSNFAWKAFKFGIDTAANTNAIVGGEATPSEQQHPTSKVSLIVLIRLEGVSVVVEPKTDDNSTSTAFVDNNPKEAITATSKSSYLSSYLEAALAAVRLSMEIYDIRVQFREIVTNVPVQPSPKWIEFRIYSLIYHDMKASTTPISSLSSTQQTTVEGQSSDYETICSKVIEVSRVTVLTGSDCNENSNTMNPVTTSVVGLLDGTTRFSIRAVEYKNNNRDTANNTSLLENTEPMAKIPEQERDSFTQMDIQVAINQKLNLSIDMTSLHIIRGVVHGFSTQQLHSISGDSTAESNLTALPSTQSIVFANGWIQRNSNDMDEDDADYRALEGIMAQYREARMLVEQKEVRGGILVPSIDDGGNVTFDAFFDANEQSYLRYSSILKESILGSILYDGSNQHALTDRIHTKFTLYLQEGGIKLTFPPLSNAPYAPNEYLLLTFNDINISSQLSTRVREFAFSIHQIELEDAVLATSFDSGENEEAKVDSAPTIGIGTVLRFVPDSDGDEDDDETDLLVRAPCLSFSFKVDSDETNDVMDIELLMEPLEVSYRNSMINRLTNFLQTDAPSHPTVLVEVKPKHRTINLTASCASVTFLVPLQIEQDWSCIYHRTGYTSESMLLRESALGFVCEKLLFEITQCDSTDKNNEASVSCHNIIAFMSSPMSQYSAFDHRIKGLDFLSICGRTEVDPCIPVLVQITQYAKGEISNVQRGGRNVLAETLFPVVPALSSFKARQDDEDDDKISDKSNTGSNINEGQCKTELNVGDPQSVMLSDVALSDIVVSIKIPEIVIDLSAKEITTLQKVISCFQLESKPSSAPVAQTDSQRFAIRRRIASSIVCDSFSVALHVDVDSCKNGIISVDKLLNYPSFKLSLQQCKVHLAMIGASPNHVRLLVHDFDFLESKFNQLLYRIV